MDVLDREILFALLKAERMRLQWKDLIATLWRKQPIKDLGTLKVYTTRKLSSFVDVGLLKKEAVSHKQVFYYIPEGGQQKVIAALWKDVADGLRTIEGLAEDLQSLENRLREWEQTKREEQDNRLGLAQFDGSFHQVLSEQEKNETERFKPVKTGLRALHRLYVTQYYSEKTVDPSDYITVINGDDVSRPLTSLNDSFFRATRSHLYEESSRR